MNITLEKRERARLSRSASDAMSHIVREGVSTRLKIESPQSAMRVSAHCRAIHTKCDEGRATSRAWHSATNNEPCACWKKRSEEGERGFCQFSQFTLARRADPYGAYGQHYLTDE